jgi:hypothetical protein
MSEKNKVLIGMGSVVVVLLGLLIFTVVTYRSALSRSQTQVQECLTLVEEREDMFDECMQKTKQMQLATRYRLCLELMDETPIAYPGGASDPCYACIEHAKDLGALTVEGCEQFVECVDSQCGGSPAYGR